MNEIKIYQNQEFGAIRTMSDKQGNPLFCAKDVANALGYLNSRKAIRDHVANEDKLEERIVTSGQNRRLTFINKCKVWGQQEQTTTSGRAGDTRNRSRHD